MGLHILRWDRAKYFNYKLVQDWVLSMGLASSKQAQFPVTVVRNYNLSPQSGSITAARTMRMAAPTSQTHKLWVKYWLSWLGKEGYQWGKIFQFSLNNLFEINPTENPYIIKVPYFCYKLQR